MIVLAASLALYFIQVGDDGPVKIGITRDPPKRLSYLQVGNPEPLNLIGAWPDSSADEEREVQGFLSGERIRGEWFRPSPPVLGFAEAHA